MSSGSNKDYLCRSPGGLAAALRSGRRQPERAAPRDEPTRIGTGGIQEGARRGGGRAGCAPPRGKVARWWDGGAGGGQGFAAGSSVVAGAAARKIGLLIGLRPKAL
ncbi:hypothetical protein ABZP36_020346 [Zizania latifolia]